MCLGLCGGGVEDDDVDLLKMLQESVEVVEMEATTGVVAALGMVRRCRFHGNRAYEFALAVKDMQCVHDGVALATAKVVSR
jgi:uncharacterized protein YerC